jgi:uncharacterized membrane protein YqhA
MRNTADMTAGKPISALLQSIPSVSAINLLFIFYDLHGGKREVLFLYYIIHLIAILLKLVFAKT